MAAADWKTRGRYDAVMAISTKTPVLKWFTREWREHRGMSQDQVAAFLDTNRGQISKLERGDLRMNDDWIAGIAHALRVEPSDLLHDPAHRSPARKQIPLVSWVNAGAFKDVDQALPTDEFPQIEIAGLPDGDWFALTVEGDSMDRISPPGSIILVNRRDRKLVPNACYVIANEAGEATYKRYRPSPERFEPVSVRSDLDPIFPDGAVAVIGRVRRSILEM